MIDGFTFDRAKHALFEMEGLLAAHGISIKSGSPLEAAGFDVLRVAEREVSLAHDMRQVLTRLVGITELAHQLHRNKANPLFGRLLPHLRMLGEDAATLQVGRSSPMDQKKNKLFELLVACWLLPIVSDIELDDPDTSSGGTNPDILATIAGTQWGIACKVMHSTNPEQLLATIEKGVEQIEASSAQRGCVIVGMKNLLDIDEYWKVLEPADPAEGKDPVFAVFESESAPFEKLHGQLAGMVLAAKHKAGLQTMKSILVRPKIVPAIVLWGHTLSPVVLGGQPVIASVRTLFVGSVSDAPGEGVTPTDRKLLEAMNDSAMANPA